MSSFEGAREQWENYHLGKIAKCKVFALMAATTCAPPIAMDSTYSKA